MKEKKLVILYYKHKANIVDSTYFFGSNFYKMAMNFETKKFKINLFIFLPNRIHI